MSARLPPIVLAVGFLSVCLAAVCPPRSAHGSDGEIPPVRDIEHPAPSWGRISKQVFVLEPPEDLLSDPLFTHPPSFLDFPREWNADQVAFLLREVGLDAEKAKALATELLRLQSDQEAEFRLSSQRLLGLETGQRALLYESLGQWHLGSYQGVAMDLGTLRITDLAAMAPHSFPEEFLTAADATVYRRGIQNLFADFPLFAARLPDPNARQDFARLLFRARCQYARLEPFGAEQAPEIIRYWTARSRNPMAATILESTLEQGDPVSLDLLHLLPPVPRSLIFTFAPRQSQIGNKRLDCFWTSRNFFADLTSERFLDIRSDDVAFPGWVAVKPPYELGDVILIIDRKNPEKIYHACNYVADELVFTKNGTSRLRPWVLQTIDDMKTVYFREGETLLQVLRQESAMKRDASRE